MCNNSLEIGHDFEDRMNEIAVRFAHAADGASYVVYAILDPTKTDPRRRYQALPFYVGETKNPHGRAIDHVRRALAQKDKYQSAKSEIYRLILANQLPRFIVLERCSTRSQSLEAELRWSQQLLKWNYSLSNCLPGQSRIISKLHYERLIANRLWKLTMAEAHAAGITITESCPSGCYRTAVELSACAASESSGRKLASIKETIAACSECQSEPTIVIAEQNGSQTSWKRPSHSTIDLSRLRSLRRQSRAVTTR